MGRWLVWLFAVFTLITLFPIYWAINTSFKTSFEVYAQPPTFVPADFTTSAYEWVLRGGTALPRSAIAPSSRSRPLSWLWPLAQPPGMPFHASGVRSAVSDSLSGCSQPA